MSSNSVAVRNTLVNGGKFVRANADIKKRLVMAVVAREKQGKTHFSLTAPGPIALFNTDIGLEGVVHKFIDKKDILVYNISVPAAKDRNVEAEAGRVWDDLENAMEQALGDPYIRTIIVDTASELWEIIRLAYFGKLTEVKPHHYAGVNAEFRRFLKRVFATDKNLLLIQKMKAEYINNNRTGEWEMQGFGDTPHIVQVVIRPYRVDKTHENEEGMLLEKGTFGIVLDHCRHNPEVIGTNLVGPMATFPIVAAMVLGTGVDEFE